MIHCLIFFEGICHWMLFCKYLWTFATYRETRKKRLMNENGLSLEGKLRWSTLLNPFYMKIFPTCSNQKRMLKGCHPHRYITCGLLFLFMTLLMCPYQADIVLNSLDQDLCSFSFCIKTVTTHDKYPLLGFLSTFRDLCLSRFGHQLPHSSCKFRNLVQVRQKMTQPVGFYSYFFS